MHGATSYSSIIQFAHLFVCLFVCLFCFYSPNQSTTRNYLCRVILGTNIYSLTRDEQTNRERERERERESNALIHYIIMII